MVDLSASGRREVLRRFGAQESVADEMLRYTENNFDASRFSGLRFPLDDEPHLAAWREYAADAAARGAIDALTPRLAQLQFPISKDISQRDDYRAATRRGVFPLFPQRLPIKRHDGVSLRIHQTVAGALPIIIAAEREDFERLVQAFSCRNEPEEVPQSMGACIVTGLNNWDRVKRYRSAWETTHGGADEAAWKAEFAQLATRKELYQDRFLILSSGPYSAVPASATRWSDDEWKRLSIEIRLEHECTHYFTYRVLGSMRNNLLDEIIADYAGLVRVIGSYDAQLALTFFGLESFPQYRQGGRLENYRGTPPLSDDAFVLLQSLVHAAIRNIAQIESDTPVRGDSAEDVAHRVVAFASASLEMLASSPDTVRALID